MANVYGQTLTAWRSHESVIGNSVQPGASQDHVTAQTCGHSLGVGGLLARELHVLRSQHGVKTKDHFKDCQSLEDGFKQAPRSVSTMVG